MAGEEKTEHIPAIFEIGLLLNGNQLFSPGEKKNRPRLGGESIPQSCAEINPSFLRWRKIVPFLKWGKTNHNENFGWRNKKYILCWLEMQYLLIVVETEYT